MDHTSDRTSDRLHYSADVRISDVAHLADCACRNSFDFNTPQEISGKDDYNNILEMARCNGIVTLLYHYSIGVGAKINHAKK